jgi:hypothetical protein
MRAVASAEVVVKGFSTTTGDWKGMLGLVILRGAESSACRRTVFATPHGFLCEFCMVVGAGADDYKLDVWVCEEVVCGAVVFCFWVVDGAVLSGFDVCFVGGCFGSLQESVHF